MLVCLLQLFLHTDGCEYLNWSFCKLFDQCVKWRWSNHITCVFVKGHPYNPV